MRPNNTSRLLPVLAFILCAATCRLPAVPADSGPTLESARQDYEQAAGKQQIKADAAIIAKGNEYVQALTTLADRLQKSGDLEGFLATKQEKERFEKEKKIPAQTPAGMAAEAARVQAEYRRTLTQAEIDKHTGLIALTDKYVAQLSLLKKRLTIQAQIEDALKVKAEADRIKSSPAVSAAEFALAELGAKRIQIEKAEMPVETVPCARCKGVGRVTTDCLKCGGTTKCVSCQGRGMVPSMLKGTGGTTRCVPCRGTGKCRECSSADKMIPCSLCQGTGKLAKANPPGINPIPATHSAPVPVAGSATEATAGNGAVMALVDSELDQYLETMSSMQKQSTSGKVPRIQAEEVLGNPMQHKGKTFQSKVYLISGHPRGIRVSATRDAIPKGGTLLVPYSMEIGTKAQNLAREIGANGEAVITYGVVNKDNITLFDISR